MRKESLRRSHQKQPTFIQRVLHKDNDKNIREESTFELVNSADLGDTSYLDYLKEHELIKEEVLPSRSKEQKRLQIYDRWLSGAIVITVILIVVLIVVAFFI
ncbi:hypothetical protein [Atopobacter phocae]|uniref:hypothetical protein n=1 Tax=Atopobacter phocae TaxID=136492 RepID=UPI0004708FBF|nr:hypothetical protein [Atopobacter phocae]